MVNTAEVIIVGGGIIGNATAYNLALKGVSVILLEGAENIGNGGSSRNGGGVRQSGRDKRELPIAMWGIKNIWPTLSEELGVECEYFQHGNLRLGKTEKHFEILTGLTNIAQSRGLDVNMIDREQIREINPFLSEEVHYASWCPTDGHANPMVTTLAFYKRARELGARFYSNAKVKEIKTIGGKAKQVITEQGDVFSGDTILVCAGYESRKILNTVGIDVPVMPLINETLVTEAQPHMFWQMLGTADADFYGHQTPHGSFAFGGHSGIEPSVRYEEGVPPVTSNTAPAICRSILGYFPMLKDAKIVRSWSGWIDVCADNVPVISRIDEIEGLVTGCGFSGHGFGIGPAVGRLLSSLVIGETPEVDLSELSFDRFQF